MPRLFTLLTLLLTLSLIISCGNEIELQRDEILLEIDGKMKPCQEILPRKCMQVKSIKPVKEKTYKPYYQKIEGYTFSNKKEQIIVRTERIENEVLYVFVRFP